jgi:hypothetical protein
MADRAPNPVDAFSPSVEISEELRALRTTRKSLGGEALKPIEIDLDIIADAYPREGNFLVSSTRENVYEPSNVQGPLTPRKGGLEIAKSTPKSALKTPHRRFFRSEHEREYARNLMKELVQIYILQGIHGKEAFRNALNETRKRIHVRRGEVAPTPPPIISPVLVSPYPKLSPPMENDAGNSKCERESIFQTPGSSSKTPKNSIRVEISVKRLDKSSDRKETGLRPNASTPRTPSRVKSIVAAIQASTPSLPKISSESKIGEKQFPTRVKAVASALECSGTDHRSRSIEADYSPKHLRPSVGTVVSESDETKKGEAGMINQQDKETEVDNTVDVGTTGVVVDISSLQPDQFDQLVGRITENTQLNSVTPSSGRKIAGIVEKKSTTRTRKKAVDIPSEGVTSPPTDRKRVRRAAAIAALEEVTAMSSKKISKGSVDCRESQISSAHVRKRPETTETKPSPKRKKSATLEPIPEDESVNMPPRPARKAKLAANKSLIKL